MRIDVAAALSLSSPEPATALLQIAVADPVEERLTVLTGGDPAEVEELEVDGARVHRFTVAKGDTTIAYTAAAETGRPPRQVTPAGLGDGAAAQPLLPVGPARRLREHRVRPEHPAR